ncbi:hypothetical protein, partial [Pseudomonas sp. AH2 (2023)]|uniref:hypothetical protein n=1 Tax=Pseudomonas sp. AH2 (2023) TaxID=3048599 RepID=UPI002B239EC9
MRSLLASLLAAALLTACSTTTPWRHGYGADNPHAGTIHEVASGREIGLRDLLARFREQDFVLVGEV